MNDNPALTAVPPPPPPPVKPELPTVELPPGAKFCMSCLGEGKHMAEGMTKKFVETCAQCAGKGYTEAPAAPQQVNITSLADLQKQIEAPLTIRVQYQGTLYAFPARRLTPEENAMLKELDSSVLPPLIKGPTAADDRHDWGSAEYLKRKEPVEIAVRSLCLYWTIPAFAAEKPALKKREEIVAFVQTKLTAPILEALYMGIRKAERPDIIEATNF